MIERHLDYLQASLSLSESAVIMKGFKPLPAVRFYKRGYQHPNGFRLYFGNPNSPKAMAVAAGDVLQSLRNDQTLDADILNWILSENGEISRIDLAVTEWNTFEGLLSLGDVERWFTQGLIDSPLIAGGCKEIAEIRSNGRAAQSVYIGDMKRRGKRGIFRAYDKGIELDLGEYMATRIELELKREKAHNTAKRLAESNDIAGNFRSHFNVKSKDFERLMDADAVSTKRGKNVAKEEESAEIARRWDWLLNQVAPALKQAILDERKRGNGDTRLIQFMQASGIIRDAYKIADHLSETKYQDKLRRNELVPRSGKEED